MQTMFDFLSGMQTTTSQVTLPSYTCLHEKKSLELDFNMHSNENQRQYTSQKF